MDVILSSEPHPYRLDDVLNEEGGGAHVVHVAVEEAEALLGEEVHGDDVVEAPLDLGSNSMCSKKGLEKCHQRPK